MVRLLIDENVNHRILRGLRLRFKDLDYVAVQATSLRGEPDSTLLVWAEEQNRVVVTHDVQTMPGFALQRLRASLSIPGVIVVPERLPIGAAIEELSIVIECAQPEELRNRIVYLPL